MKVKIDYKDKSPAAIHVGELYCYKYPNCFVVLLATRISGKFVVLGVGGDTTRCGDQIGDVWENRDEDDFSDDLEPFTGCITLES